MIHILIKYYIDNEEIQNIVYYMLYLMCYSDIIMLFRLKSNGLVIIKLNMLYLIYYLDIIMLKRYYLFVFVIIINIM